MSNKKITCPLSDSELIALRDHLGCKEELTIQFLKVALENAIVFDGKQADYGPRNISDFGASGIVMRINDKLSRLKQLLGTKRRKARNESVEDSFLDTSNYGIIGQLWERGIWPR